MASDCERDEEPKPPIEEEPQSPVDDPQSPSDGQSTLPGDDQRWKCLLFYLCFYGFMNQLRPGESFITPYLLSSERNFTKEQVLHRILVFSFL